MEEGLTTLLKIIGAFLAIAAGIYVIGNYVYPLMADVLNLAGVEDICEKTGLTVKEYELKILTEKNKGNEYTARMLYDEFKACFPEEESLKQRMLEEPISNALKQNNKENAIAAYETFKKYDSKAKYSDEEKIRKYYLELLADSNTPIDKKIQLYESVSSYFPETRESINYDIYMQLANAYVVKATSVKSTQGTDMGDIYKMKTQGIYSYLLSLIDKGKYIDKKYEVWFMKAESYGYPKGSKKEYSSDKEADEAIKTYAVASYGQEFTSKATLQIARTYNYHFKDTKKALEYYYSVIDNYPQTPEAAIAKNEIQSLSEQF